MAVKLRLLKNGNKRFTTYVLPEYILEELQEMLDYAIDKRTPLHVQYQKAGVEKKLTFNPGELNSHGELVYERIELLVAEEFE